MNRLNDLLNGNGGSYILPFFWMHGEDHAAILEEIERVQQCGIHELCLESRPHPDFCGPHWWRDLDLILGEAGRRGMRVWVLDDDRFPTGHCNGGIESEHPELARLFLAERHVDVCGPCRDSALRLGDLLPRDGQVQQILACPKPSWADQRIDTDGAIDLTDGYTPSSGLLRFSLPEGRYRVFVLYTTHTGGSRENFMNLIDTHAVRVLIDEVYEKHYERYSALFGTTFAGFFSDEPELGNLPGYDMECEGSLGTPGANLPWSGELQERLEAIWPGELGKNLIELWYVGGEATSARRFEYMDAVSDLVYRCFSGQLGNWCQAHGVEYIGHIIEDAGAHARMGPSIAHYFREQKGQHRAGIDLVHFQIVPGFDDPVHRWIDWETDAEFFYYGLAKLGSSAAHIDPEKRGRSLCEIFGNYGWAEGTSLMRWLSNHMLVRGINHFTPHAFSPKQFPDTDCPPHFYARGNNPQFPFFADLMRYLNRACHLIEGGVPLLDAAVLYHAESEWCGQAMPFHVPARALMERQLDLDVVPADALADVQLAKGSFRIGQGEYRALVLPRAERIPEQATQFALHAFESGVPVFAVDALPLCDTRGNPLPDGFIKAVCVVPLIDLADALLETATPQVRFSQPERGLRCLRYQQPDGLVCMFFNEETLCSVHTRAAFQGGYRSVRLYDPWTNTQQHILLDNGSFALDLHPGQALFAIPDADAEGATPQQAMVSSDPVLSAWRVTLIEQGGAAIHSFELPAGAELSGINAGLFGEFVGTIRYEGAFECRRTGGQRLLRFDALGDCARVFVNGQDAGSVVGTPNSVDLTPLLSDDGRNALRVDVANTLFWRVRDGVSAYLAVPASGMTQPPVLERWRAE